MAKIPAYPALTLAELDPTTALYVVDGGQSRRLLADVFRDWIAANLPAVGQGSFVRLDINGRLPALDGRRLTNLPSTGGGGGAVSSVNDQIGAVVLTAADVGAAPASHTHAFASLTSIPVPLSTIGALTAAADRLPYYTSGSAAALTTLTTFARSLLDDADAAAARNTLGLGSAATYSTAALPISTAVQAALDLKADGSPAVVPIATMLADTTPSRTEGSVLQARAPGGSVFSYTVAASGATDHHLTTAGGVKLYAVPADGIYMTPEQLGYTAAAQNWGQVAQIAFNAGYVLRLGPQEYLTSTTAFIRSRSGVVGEGSRVSGVRAVDGFTGNVIDTANFDTLAATDAVNHSDGVLQQPILRGLYIDGNRAAFGATVTASNGFGVRLYGRQMILDDVRIVKTAGVGLMMQLSQVGVVTETYHPKDHAKAGVLRDVFIYDSGEENFIFRGPTDIRIDTLYAGWAAGSLGTSYNASKTSLHYPGETVDSMVFDNAGCEIGQIHAFDNKNGWGVKIRSNVVEIDYNSATAMTGVAPGTTMTGATSGATGVLVSKYANGWTGTLIVRPVTGTFQAGESISGGGGTATIGTVIARSPRFRCTDFMSERNYGQLWIGPQVRYEIEGEVHNNEGGAGARPMIEDNSTVGGLARFKAVRGGTENGSSIVELKGSKGLWNIQAQTPSARAGHGIDLSGTDYIVTAMVERASGTNFAGETSSGIIFRPGNARNRVTAKARECGRSFWIQSGSSAGNILDLESYAHTGGAGADFFGLANLGFTERRMGRFVSSAASYPWGEMPINGPELTIASGAITLTHNAHPVDTESDAASDDLATVTAASWVVVGSRITLRAASSARTVRLVEGGNLRLGGAPIELDDATDRVVLEWDGSQWVVLLGASGGSSGPATVPTFTSVALMLADTNASRAEGDALRVETSDGLLFEYRVAASAATNHHFATAGGAKLYAVPAAGLYMTPEQLGYTQAAANWGAVAQIAWNAGYVLRLGAREYLTSSTAFIRSRTGVIGDGDRISGVKAAAGFGGNIIDTSDFAARVSGGSVLNDDETALGALYGVVLRDFYIDGNRANVPAGTATTGIGVRLYGRMPAITNLRIVYCAAHGMQTALASGTADPFNSLNHSRIGFVDGLWVMDCGREGWIFQGPADIPCDRVFIGNNGKAGSGVYDALSPTRSLVFPGETCDGLVLDNVGAEFSNGHVWNHQHGRGIRIRTDASGVRARFFNMISEGNWGQVHIESGARVEFYGEIHGNDGGPRNARVFYDATNNAGTAWEIGQTLTGATSGAVGTITSIESRTSSTGLLTVSFASDAARERRFADNETVSNGLGRTAVVYRPDYIGAVPWWRDDSMQGNLVSLKVFQTGLNDGGTMLRIGGQNHVYTVQAQSSTPRFGHGIDLYGDNVTISGYMEGRARTAPNGQASAGLIVRAGAERANIDLTVKSCQQNVLFEDDCADSRISVASVDPLADHFNGVDLLTPAAAARAHLLAVTAGSVVWESQHVGPQGPEGPQGPQGPGVELPAPVPYSTSPEELAAVLVALGVMQRPPQAPDVTYTHVGSASAAAATLTMPAHQAGDIIIGFMLRSTNTPPVPPTGAGWTILAAAGSGATSYAIFWKRAASNAEAWGTGGTATASLVEIYRPSAYNESPIAAFGRRTIGAGTEFRHLGQPEWADYHGNNAAPIVVVSHRAAQEATQLAIPGTSLAESVDFGTATAALLRTTAAVNSFTTYAQSGFSTSAAGQSLAVALNGFLPAAGYDVQVSDTAGLLAAMDAVPQNLNRDYVIQLAPGTYTHISRPNYTRGSTRVVLIAGDRNNMPRMASIDVQGSSRVTLQYLHFRGTALDAFGFPQGSSSSARGIVGDESSFMKVLGCLVENYAFGVQMNAVSDAEIAWNTIRSFAVDGLRLYGKTGSPVRGVHVHHNHISVNSPSIQWPQLDTRGLHYALDRACAIDPRRSDQLGYGGGNGSYVQPVSGSPIFVADGTKLGRHPDCIQGAMSWQGVVIEDNFLETNNVYCHGIFTQTGPSSGVMIRRNQITSAHVNAICVDGWDATCLIEQCLIRPWPGRNWAVGGLPNGQADSPAHMQPVISTRKNSVPMNINNTVTPAFTNSTETPPGSVVGTGNVNSDSAVPTGWASTDVANNNFGHSMAP